MLNGIIFRESFLHFFSLFFASKQGMFYLKVHTSKKNASILLLFVRKGINQS